MSAEETRKEFESLCRRLTDGDNYFFGRQQIETSRQRVATAGLDPERQLAAAVELGFQWIEHWEPPTLLPVHIFSEAWED